ncbi:MAG: GNAT family N-acetyltransferase [Acidovorax sp.]|uniref:GNAT family N-acetyltransferase n=1 Tax=Acidovorax sp. TaxID=1872122 RepID=UPI0039E34F48
MRGDIPPVSIHGVDVLDAEVLGFLLQARAALFAGRMDLDAMPPDLRHFAQSYGTAPGRMLVARGAEGRVVGSIACRAYDHRFAHLHYPNGGVVEVVRLYVAPGQRRQGLARRLFLTLKAHALAQGVNTLYLHTHPFLPGAIDFWRAMGFRLLCVDDDPPWRTTHMEWVARA